MSFREASEEEILQRKKEKNIIIEENNKKSISSFYMFFIIMILISQFIIIVVLFLQNKSTKDALNRSIKDRIPRSLMTFEMLPQNIKKLYLRKRPKGFLEKALQDDTDEPKEKKLDFRKTYTHFDNDGKKVFVAEVLCDQMSSGSSIILGSCEQSLVSFFSQTSKSMIFEVTPLVQASDLLDLTKVMNILNNKDYKKYYIRKDILNDFTIFLRDGLAHRRLTKGIEKINENFGEKVKIKINTSYQFTKSKSGFRIRAYNVL